MKIKRRTLALMLCLALAAVAVGGTLAYLTDTDEVTNTFTVGKVDITLDEAAANPDGSLIANAPRRQTNSYKLIPGHTYNKDPMVTVKQGSEESYVRMLVTVTKARELDAIFDPEQANLPDIFQGYDAQTWISKGSTDNTTDNTRTFEFWYKDAVAAPDSDVALDALFDKIVVPGWITQEQLKTINEMTITAVAHAIQADGFENAGAAWEKFTVPTPTEP